MICMIRNSNRYSHRVNTSRMYATNKNQLIARTKLCLIFRRRHKSIEKVQLRLNSNLCRKHRHQICLIYHWAKMNQNFKLMTVVLYHCSLKTMMIVKKTRKIKGLAIKKRERLKVWKWTRRCVEQMS